MACRRVPAALAKSGLTAREPHSVRAYFAHCGVAVASELRIIRGMRYSGYKEQPQPQHHPSAPEGNALGEGAPTPAKERGLPPQEGLRPP